MGVGPLQGLSFVVVTYNNANTIAECLTSVFAQRAKPLEVFVVDNASTDRTLRVIESGFPDAVLIRNERNVGFGAANNTAARAAKGSMLGMVNPDAVLDREWSYEVALVIRSHPRCAAAEGKLLLAERPDFINCAGSSINLLGFGCMNHYGESAAVASMEKTVGYASGAAFVVRRDAFLEVGGFDESYFLYQEDVELGLRLYEAGWKIRYVPRAIAYHHYRPNLSDTKLRYLEANRWKTLARHMPVGYFVICGPLIALFEAGLVASLISGGLLPSKVKAILDFLKDLRETLRARRTIIHAAAVPWAAMQLITDDFPRIIPRTDLARVLGERFITAYHRAFLKRYALTWTQEGDVRGT